MSSLETRVHIGILTERSHIAAYQVLLNELHTVLREVSPALFETVSTSDNECVISLWRGTKLIGTAQASLMFPGMRPVVHVSNVVVTHTERGRSYGELLLRYLRRVTRQRWRDYGPLRYELTSRQERGTSGFYERLGYTGTPTVRYVK